MRRIFPLLLLACLTMSPLGAETDPFVGQWKLVTLTDQMTVTKVGANTYAFDFGDAVETIVADGADHPGAAGTILSVAAVGPNWKVIRKQGSRVLISATTAVVNSVIMLQVRPYGSNGLSFVIPSQGATLNVTFDGSSARRLNARTVEIIRASENKITQTRDFELSPDLKTPTMTLHLAGKPQPYVYVFERQ